MSIIYTRSQRGKLFSGYSLSFLVAITFLIVNGCKGSKEEPPVAYENETSIEENGLRVRTVSILPKSPQPGPNSFNYGQTVVTKFMAVQGFREDKDEVQPSLSITVTNLEGDTLLYEPELLNGLSQPKDTELSGILTLAHPMRSGHRYMATYVLSDLKSNASLIHQMPFKIEPDSHFQIMEKGLKVGEVYCLNTKKNTIISDGKIPFDEQVSLNLQFLEGYTKSSNGIRLGMSVTVQDAKGKLIVNEEDVLKGQSYFQIHPQEIIYNYLQIPKGNIHNPVDWKVKVWDKNSDASLKVVGNVSLK